MKNLEQVRARNALKCPPIQGKQGGEVMKKIPALVINHGLLAVAAYANDNAGYATAFDYIASHLSDPEIDLLPHGCNTHKKMMDHLSSNGTSQELRDCTNEAMAWLNYARRFVKKD